MSKKNLFYTGFFVVLALVFYFVLTRIIPGFGEKKLPPISFVRPFHFTNQDGGTVTDKDMAGKVYAVEFFYTTCKVVCPMMNNNMRKVYDALKNEPDFYILSHTCDPENDSAVQLKKYSDSLGVDTKHWIFLTGRKDSLYTAARVSYTLDDPNNNLTKPEDKFLHTQKWALVDKNGDVRAVYDGLKESEAKEMISKARSLLKEKAK